MMRYLKFLAVAALILFPACQKSDDTDPENKGNGPEEVVVDVDYDAIHLDGYYYGEKYGAGADRYAFFLSEQGLNNMGQAYTNGAYYYVDVFSPAHKTTAIPAGTYRFDASNSGAPYTINSSNSQLILTGEGEEDTRNIFFTDATMTVTAGKIVLDAVIDGELHRVTYMGDLHCEDASDENGGGQGGNDDPVGGQENDPKTTLTGDYEITFPGEHRAKWIYEGDYWKTGYSNYTIMIMNKMNGYVCGGTLQLDIITDDTSKDGDFYGTYNCSYTPGRNVMMAGFTNDYAQAVGSWFFDYVNGGGSYNGYAMLVDGKVDIINNGNGTSTIRLSAYDCMDNHITCDWTGIIEED